MVMSYKAGPELGIIEVHTTDEGGHSTEFWAKRCIEKMIHVSDDAPEEIKKQVQAYKDNIEKLIELYMQNAIKSDRITINNELEKAGLKEAADLIRKF
jgi:adenylate kinase family enzyme